MTRSVWPEEQVQMMKPDYVAPVVGVLCSERPPANGQLYEVGCGWVGADRWQRARGVDFDYDQGIPTLEQLAEVWGPVYCMRPLLTMNRPSQRSATLTMA
jgi:multifunctional beta-oxidation protein